MHFVSLEFAVNMQVPSNRAPKEVLISKKEWQSILRTTWFSKMTAAQWNLIINYAIDTPNCYSHIDHPHTSTRNMRPLLLIEAIHISYYVAILQILCHWDSLRLLQGQGELHFEHECLTTWIFCHYRRRCKLMRASMCGFVGSTSPSLGTWS